MQNSSTTGQQLDLFTCTNLTEAVMTIIDIFEESDRVKSILTKVVKILTQTKDRVIRKQAASNAQKVKRAVDGLNEKLK